ncbi:MAG: type II toxin-antitoxin system Phd/YefM family antitoxin [Pseudomonadota bacterium]
MQVSIADAKARFAEIIRRAESGEEIVLTRHGRPVAHLSPAVRSARVPLVGALAGQIEMADDFDVLPDDFLHAFTGDDAPS